MKNKIVTIMMALAVVLTAASSWGNDVFAAEKNIDMQRGEASITISPNNATKSLMGKKFAIYKLFNAQNAVHGESINYTFNPECKSALQNVVGKKLGKVPAEVTEYEAIDYINSLNSNKVEGAAATQIEEGSYSNFRYFIEDLRNEMVAESVSADVLTVDDVNPDGTLVIGGLEYGYYIVDEISDNQGEHSASSLCMVTTANPEALIKIKSDYPTVSKKIQEDDQVDLIGNNGWNDMADYEIGQTVPYKFTSNVPNMNGYDKYFYSWHDVMDEALTLNPESIKITISDNNKNYKLQQSEFVVNTNPGNQLTFKVDINDLKKIVDREFNKKDHLGHNTYGQTVTLTYNATLNDNAAKNTGTPGFENDVRLEFSNDADGNGHGKTGLTPWDTVVCFTYKLDVLKTNDHDQVLESAKFRLYSDEECKNEVLVKSGNNGYIVINRDSVGGTDHIGGSVPDEAVEMSSDKNGNFVIFGLDSGTYYLKETKAPDGYRVIEDPIKLTVKATMVQDRNNYKKGDGAADKALVALDYSVAMKQFLSGKYEAETKKLVTDIKEGSGNLTVVNYVGSKLPVTGSAATVVMIGLGSAIMVLSGKKKNEK